MAQLQVKKIMKVLQSEGFDQDQSEKIEKAIISNIPPGAYNKAVIFLGWVTVALALGSILLAGLDKPLPDALWGALGAGIGGLAGIFMGNQ